MKKLLLILFLTFFCKFYSQEYIIGKVVSEQNIQVANVLVINVKTDEKTYTDQDGNFIISAKNGDVIRFVKQKFDRVSYNIQAEDFKKSLVINLMKSSIEIQEIELKNKLTGNLREDVKRVEAKQKSKLNGDVNNFILEKTDINILKPSKGEFVQPKGEGFSVGKINNRWDDVDVQVFILYILREDYFEQLGLRKEEISPFINVVIQNMDTKTARKYGYLRSNDIAKFQELAEEKIKTFKKLK